MHEVEKLLAISANLLLMTNYFTMQSMPDVCYGVRIIQGAYTVKKIVGHAVALTQLAILRREGVE